MTEDECKEEFGEDYKEIWNEALKDTLKEILAIAISEYYTIGELGQTIDEVIDHTEADVQDVTKFLEQNEDFLIQVTTEMADVMEKHINKFIGEKI